MYIKKYIEVIAKFDTDGNIIPLKVRLDDDVKAAVDKVLDIRHAASLKAGGAGIRYTCRVLGKELYLFLEENRWFIEQQADLDNII